jgi:hypothetical protein
VVHDLPGIICVSLTSLPLRLVSYAHKYANFIKIAVRAIVVLPVNAGGREGLPQPHKPCGSLRFDSMPSSLIRRSRGFGRMLGTYTYWHLNVCPRIVLSPHFTIVLVLQGYDRRQNACDCNA